MTTPSDRPIEAGDIVVVDFSSVRGTEQDGIRPALVISERAMHEGSRRAFICPITRNETPWPTKVILPSGLAATGAVLVDQMRSVDRSERILRTLGRVPDGVLLNVRDKLAALTGIEVSVVVTDRID